MKAARLPVTFSWCDRQSCVSAYALLWTMYSLIESVSVQQVKILRLGLRKS